MDGKEIKKSDIMEHKRLEEILKQELAWTLAQVRKAGCLIFYLFWGLK